LIEPLRKRRKNDGQVYTRLSVNEQKLQDLVLLPSEELVKRCTLPKTNDGYVPSECIVYFVRRSASSGDEKLFEKLFKILAARFQGLLPRPENAGGESVSFTKIQVMEHAFDRFVTMILEERSGKYVEGLDIYEVVFNSVVALRRIDAQRKSWKEENRSTTLEVGEESTEIASEVEEAAGQYDPFDPDEIQNNIYRLRLADAISQLPQPQKVIVEMLRQGVLIESIDPKVDTISKLLGISEKTVRNRRDKAFEKLRKILDEGGLL
jgi:RNA polymerase sigma factor (sigma-70 family)